MFALSLFFAAEPTACQADTGGFTDTEEQRAALSLRGISELGNHSW